MTRTLAALSVASLLLLSACSSDAQTVCDFEDTAATSYATLNATLDELGVVSSSEAYAAGDMSELNAWGAEARDMATDIADSLDKQAALVGNDPIAADYATAKTFVTDILGALADASAEATDAESYTATINQLFTDTAWVERGDAGDAAFAKVDEYVLAECAAA